MGWPCMAANTKIGNISLFFIEFLFVLIMSKYVYRLWIPNFMEIKKCQEKNLKKIRIHRIHRRHTDKFVFWSSSFDFNAQFLFFILLKFNYFVFVMCNVNCDQIPMLMLISLFWFYTLLQVHSCIFPDFYFASLFFVLILILCMSFLSIG